MIDVRELQYIELLEKCHECGRGFVTKLILRHDCGCYLRKEIAEQAAKPWWKKLLGL
jgi:hypothetical protein